MAAYLDTAMDARAASQATWVVDHPRRKCPRCDHMPQELWIPVTPGPARTPAALCWECWMCLTTPSDSGELEVEDKEVQVPEDKSSVGLTIASKPEDK